VTMRRARAAAASRARARWAARLRVGLLLAAVAAAAGVVALHTARARAAEGILDVGEGLLTHLGPHRRDPPRELVLNGLVLHVASGSIERPAAAVIDGFSMRCRERGPRLDRDLMRRGAPGRALAAALPRSLLDATLRVQSPGRAAAVCLHTSRVGFEELGVRLQRFADTGDVADLGDLSFVYAEQHAQRTTYVVLESTGSVPLREMFPESGDAPGRDLSGLPRPEGARRVLSAWQADARPMLAAYAVEASPAAAARRYGGTLQRAGLSLHARGGDGRAPWLVASAGERAWLASFRPTSTGTQVAITQLD